jgi:hypothetical protein
MFLRSGMEGYQYAGLSVADAMARHKAGRRPPVVAILVGGEAPAVPSEPVDGLQVRAAKLPAGIVYLVTRLDRPLETPAVQPTLAMDLD